jgi:hypothetical protein
MISVDFDVIAKNNTVFSFSYSYSGVRVLIPTISILTISVIFTAIDLKNDIMLWYSLIQLMLDSDKNIF